MKMVFRSIRESREKLPQIQLREADWVSACGRALGDRRMYVKYFNGPSAVELHNSLQEHGASTVENSGLLHMENRREEKRRRLTCRRNAVRDVGELEIHVSLKTRGDSLSQSITSRNSKNLAHLNKHNSEEHNGVISLRLASST